MKRILLAAVAASMIVLPAQDADADATPGLRLGLTDDPESFFAGVQFQTLLSGGRSARIYFVPGVDFGIGDEGPDYWTVRGTGHFEFHFPLGRRGDVSIFPLVGLTLYYINFDLPEDFDDDEIDIAVDAGGGFMWDRFKFEVWLGVDDEWAPEVTVAFGVMF